MPHFVEAIDGHYINLDHVAVVNPFSAQRDGGIVHYTCLSVDGIDLGAVARDRMQSALRVLEMRIEREAYG